MIESMRVKENVIEKINQKNLLGNVDGDVKKRVIYGKISSMIKGLGRNSADLVFIEPKNHVEWKPAIEKIHNVLKDTGSLYLHCDTTSEADFRKICDEIFNRDNFMSHIIVKCSEIKKNNRNLIGIETESILFYTKSKKSYFNRNCGNLIEKSIRMWHFDDLKGMNRREQDLTMPGESNVFEWRGILPPKGRSWRLDKNNLELRVREGQILLKEDNYTPYFTSLISHYKELPRKTVTNLWNDISLPEDSDLMFERIVRASSKENGTVLIVPCQRDVFFVNGIKLNRSVVGIDDDITRCKMVADRIELPRHLIENVELNQDEIDKINGYEFQQYICNKVNATCNKKGSDKGIDGYTNKTEIPIQVKKYIVGRPDISQFINDIRVKGYKIGAVFGLGFSKEANLERENALNYDGIDIKFYTHEQVLKGKTFDDRISYREIIHHIVKSPKYMKVI